MDKFWRRFNINKLLQDFEPYVSACSAPLALLILLSLVDAWVLWGCNLEPSFAPGPSVVVLSLVTSDEVSELAGYYWETELTYLWDFHSLVLDKLQPSTLPSIK